MGLAYVHAASFTILLILFMIGVVLASLDMKKAGRTTHLLFRIVAGLVLLSGTGLVIHYLFDGSLWYWALIKMLFGLLLIASMEVLLLKSERQQRTGLYWIIFCIGIAATFTIGFSVIQ